MVTVFVACHCVLFVIVERVAFSEGCVIVGLPTALMEAVTVVEIVVVVAHRVGRKLTVPHLLSVGLLMGGQVAALGESLVAVLELADVRLLPSVRPVVSPEVEVEGELLSADISSEGLLSLKKAINYYNKNGRTLQYAQVDAV